VSLRKYAEHLGNGGEISLQDFALKDLGRFEPQIKKAVEDGAKFLWLLDGLDEARGWQKEIRDSIRDIPGDLVLASWPVGYRRGGLEALPHFEVLPLSPEDTDKFLRDWFGHLSMRLEKPADWTEERVNWLKDQLSKKKGIEPLARNPLLLTFLVILAGQDPLVDLPERRSEIFEKYVQKLLLSWEDHRLPRHGPTGETALCIGSFEGKEAQDALLKGFHWIGWFLHLSYYSGCSENVCGAIGYRPFREDLEAYLKERLMEDERLGDSQAKGAAGDIVNFWHNAGILDVWELEEREYLAFRHLAFQEYASARILLDIWRKDPGRAWSFLQPRLHHRAWQQPMLLMAGKMEPKEIDSFLERIRKNHGLWQEVLLLLLGGLGKRSPAAILRMLARGSPYERILHLDLRLCMDALNECGYASHSWESQSADLILGQAAEVAVNGITWTHPFRNHLLDRNMPEIGPLMEHAGEMKRIFHSSLSPLLKYPEPGVRMSTAKALGKLEDTRAVPALLSQLRDDDLVVRESAAGVLSKLADTQIVPDLLALLRDPKSDVRTSAAQILGVLGDTRAATDLLSLLKDSDSEVRRSVAQALGMVGDANSVNALLALLKDEDPWVSLFSAKALAKLADAENIPSLLHLLKDTDSKMRYCSAYILGELGDSSVVPELLASLKDSNSIVQSLAAQALVKLGDKRLVPDLQILLTDSDAVVRKFAIEVLSELADGQAFPELMGFLRDPDPRVRSCAAEALGKLGDDQAVPDLLALLEDSYLGVRFSAVRALGGLGDSRAVCPLLAMLRDSDSGVRLLTVNALGELRDNRAVYPLLALLKDSDSVIQFSAAMVLGKLDDSEVVPDLLALLKDPDSRVRSYAAIALGTLRDALAVPDLLSLLIDSDLGVRLRAFESLKNFEDMQIDLPMLFIKGSQMFWHFLANIRDERYAISMFSPLEYIALNSSDLALKEMLLVDPLKMQVHRNWSGLTDVLSFNIGPLGIDLEKLKQWLKNK
jgi:HEAT repeat protein